MKQDAKLIKTVKGSDDQERRMPDEAEPIEKESLANLFQTLVENSHSSDIEESSAGDRLHAGDRFLGTCIPRRNTTIQTR